MSLSLKGLSSHELGIVLALLEGAGRGWFFGSRVWGTPQRYSDLDIALEHGGSPSIPVETLRERFEESDLVFAVDLSFLSDLPIDWQEQIQQHGVAFAG